MFRNQTRYVVRSENRYKATDGQNCRITKTVSQAACNVLKRFDIPAGFRGIGLYYDLRFWNPEFLTYNFPGFQNPRFRYYAFAAAGVAAFVR